MNMQNTMTINGHSAVISYDPEIEMFRGEFVGLNGGADFYAASVDKLHEEGTRSLQTFLDVCRERNIEPYRKFSGRFVVRVQPDIHERATEAAAASGLSLNQWVQKTLAEHLR